MNTTSLALAAAVTAALGISSFAMAQSPTPAPKPSFQNEKCYGVARAGHNDCQTATASCAGTAKRDAQADAWIYVPAGACAKINGGSPMPKI